MRLAAADGRAMILPRQEAETADLFSSWQQLHVVKLTLIRLELFLTGVGTCGLHSFQLFESPGDLPG
jgi:hypothetical protein